MTATKLAIDPLWQCLCPSWKAVPTKRISLPLRPPRRPAPRCLNSPHLVRHKSNAEARRYELMSQDKGLQHAILNPLYDAHPSMVQPGEKKPNKVLRHHVKLPGETINYSEESTPSLYNHLRGAAIDGKVYLCRFISEKLVKERGEKPNMRLYNVLILSNIGVEQGAAWRTRELLEELEQDGLLPDIGTCHAVLKVLSVHVDHLLRVDVLDYMSKKWYQLSDDGAHDVVAGLLREGLFEQALQRLDIMQQQGMRVQPWLLDMAVYILCEASEILEAYRIMRLRVDATEVNLSRSLWTFFLDKASEARHHAATSLAWSSQVNPSYMNPPCGVCLNVLATASKAADAVMATEVFTHLSKRGTTFQPLHYELLINTYLTAQPPDLKRALSILTIMALEKVEPTIAETRSLFAYLRHKPALVAEALQHLRDLHDQGRRIPIAALNLVIECYVQQSNLADALKLYKQIHTFVPIAEGAKKSFANVDTFNLLLKGCRLAEPPDEHQASFLVSELLALRVKPTLLTYDRLILVFVAAGRHAIKETANLSDPEAGAAQKARSDQLLDWAFRHFDDMRPLGWLPRFGTLEQLALALASVGNGRCWDVLQAAEDSGDNVDGWVMKAGLARRRVEEAWDSARSDAHPASDGANEKALDNENVRARDVTVAT